MKDERRRMKKEGWRMEKKTFPLLYFRGKNNLLALEGRETFPPSLPLNGGD